MGLDVAIARLPKILLNEVGHELSRISPWGTGDFLGEGVRRLNGAK